MMAGTHPEELTLLAYVEDELGAAERAGVEAHLAACERCQGEVAGARAGRDALRAAPLLELPDGARERMFVRLPPAQGEHPVARRRLAVALPLAAALAVLAGVVAFATLPGGGNDRSGGGAAGGSAESIGAAAKSPAPQDSGGATSGKIYRSVLDSVQGRPARVARALRADGFDARVEDDAVVVRTTRVEALKRALARMERGGVPVRVE